MTGFAAHLKIRAMGRIGLLVRKDNARAENQE